MIKLAEAYSIVFFDCFDDPVGNLGGMLRRKNNKTATTGVIYLELIKNSPKQKKLAYKLL
jgi:hypothetical protein